MRALAIGRLLRLSLGASAPADAAAGIVLGAGGWPAGAAPWLLPLASACVFHAGMALNDWADREHDARTRPERPIPSGDVSAGFALALGLALLAAGVGLAAWTHGAVGVGLGLVAFLVLVYDLRARGPWIGPLLLGLCRAGNLGVGVLLGSLLGGPLDPQPLGNFGGLEVFCGNALEGPTPLGLGHRIVPLVYGAYVFLVSRLGRLEDAEDELGERWLSPNALLLVLAALLLLPGLLPFAPIPEPWLGQAWLGRAAALVVGALGAFGLARRALGPRVARTTEVPPLMGLALRRLLVFTAAVALVRGSPAGWLVAALILCGYPVSHALRRVFPPS